MSVTHTKHLGAQRDRPFAAAQGDSRGPISKSVLLSTRGANCLRLFLLHELALDENLNFVTDDPPAVEQGIEGHAEFLAVDFAFRAIANAVTHRRVIEFSEIFHFQDNRVCVAFDGQVAGHGVVVLASRFDLRAFVSHRRILLCFEEVRRPQVIVTRWVIGVDTGRVDGNVNR